MTAPISPEYWGGHFPIGYWSTHFPKPRKRLILDSIPPNNPQAIVEASTPAGAGVLALMMSGQVTVTYSFGVKVNKDQSGLERRTNNLGVPNEKYEGEAMIADSDLRLLRSLLERAAAQGSIFQLGLPYEELTLIADPAANIVNTTNTVFADWAVPGQRCLIVSPGEEVFSDVVQAADSSRIVIVGNPGDIARSGGRIMPTVPVLLDATQNFLRFPSPDVETFQIVAYAAMTGFNVAPVAAILQLGPITTSGVLDGLTFVARLPGAAGNLITVQFEATTLGFGINLELDEDLLTSHVLLKFRAGVATVQDLITFMGFSALLTFDVGSYNPDDVLSSGSDEFVPHNLAGGSDAEDGEIGGGSTITMFDGVPVYDRGLVVQTSATDMIHALTTLVQLGGLPSNSSDANIPDWGRDICFESEDSEERQWFKRFIFTVRGPQVAFWLPTYRADLIVDSFTDGDVAVAASLPLAPTLVNSGALEGLTIVARAAGAAGNSITIKFVGDAISLSGDVDEDTGAMTVIVRFVPDITTADDIKALVNVASTLVEITGTAAGGTVQAGDDEFGFTHLYGGVDGFGATLVMTSTGEETIGDDFFAWYPGHNAIQIIQEDLTVTLAKIVSTYTADAGIVRLNLDASLSDSPIEIVSWLELCRFEDNDIAVVHTGATAKSDNLGRVVQQ